MTSTLLKTPQNAVRRWGHSMVGCQRRQLAGSKSCGGKISKEAEATPIRQLARPLTLNHSLISH